MPDEHHGAAPDARPENARVAYQVATSLMVYDGDLLWSKFNALLLANSILVGAIALALTGATRQALWFVMLPVVGLILCVDWFLLTVRGFDQYRYWILSARELEEQHLGPATTLSRGARFADGETVELCLHAGSAKLRIRWLGRLVSAQTASYVVISLFGALYVLALLRPVLDP